LNNIPKITLYYKILIF